MNIEYGKHINFIDGLQLVFITLKLCGVIDWSWIKVLSPIWLTAIVALIILSLGNRN